MKLAKTNDGQLIEASATAPDQAVCPLCGAILTLRSRRTMNNGKATYFWRHPSNKNTDCSGRKRPVG